MNEFLGEGIHLGISEERYHSDPCEFPSASSSILKTVYNRSPEHARCDHPRLNPDFEAPDATEFQIAGTILHSLILNTPPRHRVLEFDAYRTNEAKAAKKATLDEGLIPILEHKFAELAPVATALRQRIERIASIRDAIAKSEKEVTLVWREGGVLCRGRVDILPPANCGIILDLKFTSRSAEPEGWGRTLVNEHLFQGALYPRGVEKLRGDKPEMVYAVCETDAPYGLSLHAMDPMLDDLANRRLDAALVSWGTSVRSGKWPGYSTGIHYHEPPPWEVARHEARMFRESTNAGDRYARLEQAAGGPPS